MISAQRVIAQTQYWLEHVVIGLNFCPFAKPVFAQQKIHYQVSESTDLESCLHDLIDEARRLDASSHLETTLLIYPRCLQDFDDFLDALAIANDLMDEQGYSRSYQLASFHPDYCFADSEANDAANYTNRSPYAMWHLIRERSIERALDAYPQSPESIPDANIERARSLGLVKMQALLQQALDSH